MKGVLDRELSNLKRVQTSVKTSIEHLYKYKKYTELGLQSLNAFQVELKGFFHPESIYYKPAQIVSGAIIKLSQLTINNLSYFQNLEPKLSKINLEAVNLKVFRLLKSLEIRKGFQRSFEGIYSL